MKPGYMTNVFYVAKMGDKFWIFEECLRGGRMEFSALPEPFHTAEDAHKWLLDQAAGASTDVCKINCAEVVREFIFTREVTNEGMQ